MSAYEDLINVILERGDDCAHRETAVQVLAEIMLRLENATPNMVSAAWEVKPAGVSPYSAIWRAMLKASALEPPK